MTVYAKRGDKSGKKIPILLWLSQLYGYAHIYAKFCAGRLYTFGVTPIFIRGYRKRCLRETAIFMRTAMFPYNSVSRYVQNLNLQVLHVYECGREREGVHPISFALFMTPE